MCPRNGRFPNGVTMTTATFKPVNLLLEEDGHQTHGDIELNDQGLIIRLTVDRLGLVKITAPVQVDSQCVPDGPGGGVVVHVTGSTIAGVTVQAVVLRRAFNAAMTGRPVYGTWSTLRSPEPNLIISHEWRP